MKKLRAYITEKLKVGRDTDLYFYRPTSHDELQKLVVKLVNERGADADLNDIDVSHVTDMTNLFLCSSFRGDISGWDVSNVVVMRGMFSGAKFCGDISRWNVSTTANTRAMFALSPLSQKEPAWFKP